MQHSLPRRLPRQPLAALVTLACLSSACAEDLKLDNDPVGAPAAPVVTEPGADGFTTRVDASDSDAWIYFSFLSGAQVIPADPATSLDWDLGFQRFHIISNGGASGSGGASVAVLVDQAFDAVTAAPGDGYLTDQPDSDDEDTFIDNVFEEGDGWYDYDDTTNRLSPRLITYVIQTMRGAHYKLGLLDYYDEAGSSGHPSFTWAELP